MSRVNYNFLVAILAAVLISPIAGVNQNIIESKSELLANDFSGQSRDGDYDVIIELAPSNEGLSEVTRCEELTAEFQISNTGDLDDTYVLSVTWYDEYNYGWYAEPVQETVSVASGTQEFVLFTFQAPVQFVVDEDEMDYTVTASSENSTVTSSDITQKLVIDNIYAVDVYMRQGDAKEGNRGDSVFYSVEMKNVGQNGDNFSIDTSEMPKDWSALLGSSYMYLDPQETGTFTLEVIIPDTAAEEEYAFIQVLVNVQAGNYDYIYNFCNSNTTVEDGRHYAVDIIPDAYHKMVIPGGQILYNLYVTNDGDEVDSFILELKDVMAQGWGSNLSQFIVEDLGPQEEAVVVMNVTSPSDSIADDSSPSEIVVRSANREQFSDNVELSTSVRIPERGLDLTVEDFDKKGDPSTTVVYHFSLENTGTDPDDFSLSIERCNDCSAWGATLSTYHITDLDDGDFYDFEMHIEIPDSARNTDSAEMTVIAQSDDDSEVEQDVYTITGVDKVLNRHITWDSGMVLNPGDSSDIDISISNYGNSYQSYTFESDELPNGWEFDNFPYQTDDLEPYVGDESFSVPFTVSDNENPGYYNFTIDVILDEDNYKIESFEVSVKIEYYAEFYLDVIAIESFESPGDTHFFDVEITNNANIDDTISLSIFDVPLGWTTCFRINQDCFTEITVSEGMTSSFVLEITTNYDEPANTANGIFLYVEGVSGLNNKVSSFDTLSIYTNPVYELTMVINSDFKEGVSGDVIPFQVTITNVGNDNDFIRLPHAVAPVGWLTYWSESQFMLGAQQSKIVYLNVEVPENVYGGNNMIDGEILSDQSGQALDLHFIVYIDEKPDIDIELKLTAGEVMAGTTGKFTVRLTNNGNTVENLKLTIEGKRASWFTLPPDSVRLEPGDFQEIVIEVEPPIMQAATETSGMLNVTGSQTDKLSLPFTVLKSDSVVNEPITEEEDGILESLPSLSFFSGILVISLISRLGRRR
ncbi:MAG: hypothetical protein ACJZ33_03295 [Candidatus Poseidoniales archaeon]